VPKDEDSLSFKVMLSLNNVLSKVLAIVANFCPHIVNHEWFSKVVLVVRERHCLKVECHHSAAFNITESELTCSSVHINVEKFGYWGAILREIWVSKTSFPFLIVIDYVISGWSKKFVQLFILENLIKNPDLINSRLSTFISNTSSCHKSRECEMNFPDWCN
jgi:hypothetical protein